MDSFTPLLTRLCEFAEKIDAALATNDWDWLNELLIQRQQCLENLFEGKIPKNRQTDVTEIINKIQNEDEGSVAALKNRKNELQNLSLSLVQGRKNIKAYQVDKFE